MLNKTERKIGKALIKKLEESIDNPESDGTNELLDIKNYFDDLINGYPTKKYWLRYIKGEVEE